MNADIVEVLVEMSAATQDSSNAEGSLEPLVVFECLAVVSSAKTQSAILLLCNRGISKSVFPALRMPCVACVASFGRKELECSSEVRPHMIINSSS